MKNHKLAMNIVDYIFWSLLFLLVDTEILSVCKAITSLTVIISWIIWLLFSLYICKLNINISDIKNSFSNTKGNRIFIAVLITVMLITLGISYVTTSANWDSMCYHMPRVMYWIQNQSIDYYATSATRQAYSPPYSEYMIMHIALILGTSVHSCIMNGICYFLSAIVVYKMCRKLEVNIRYSLVAVALFMMMPPAIAESMTTQSDMCSALTLLLAVYYLIDFLKMEEIIINKVSIVTAVKFGGCVILCYLAKSNVLINLVIIVILVAVIRIVKKDKIKSLIIVAGIGLITALVLWVPSLIRSVRVYQSVLPKGQMAVVVKTWNPLARIVCSYENLSEYFNTNLIPGWTHLLLAVGYGIARILGITNEGNVIGNTYDFYSDEFMYHHDVCCNFPLFIILICTVIVICKGCLKKQPRLKWLFLTSVISLVVLAGSVHFTRYKTRLFLPIAAVLIPISIASIVRAEAQERLKGIMIGVIITVTVLSAGQAISFNIGHNIENRSEGAILGGYFVDNGDEEKYIALTDYVNSLQVHDIAIWGQDFAGDYEYPLWMMLEGYDRILHVNVEDEYLGALEDYNYIPECIIATNTEITDVVGDTIICHGHDYICTWQFEDKNYRVYELIE